MVNDISIAGVIIFIFITLGILLPFVQEEFNAPIQRNDVNALNNEVGDAIKDAGSKSIFSIVTSVAKMFFWTNGIPGVGVTNIGVSSGRLPFWIDIFFLPLRLMLALILVRNIWIGGGG